MFVHTITHACIPLFISFFRVFSLVLQTHTTNLRAHKSRERTALGVVSSIATSLSLFLLVFARLLAGGDPTWLFLFCVCATLVDCMKSAHTDRILRQMQSALLRLYHSLLKY